MSVKPLTVTEVKGMKPREKDYAVYDGFGLLLNVSKAGGKVWRFRYSHPITKKRQTYTIGRFPEFSLAEAREERDELRRMIARGVDPVTEKKNRKIEMALKNLQTFEVVANAWFAFKKGSELRKPTLYNIEYEVYKYLVPFFGKYSIDKITAPLATISVTQDVLLSAISGAILLGIGLGIVFSVDGSTGGTDLIALMVNRVIPSLPVSKCLTIIDGMVVLSAGIANGNIETGLYSAIALYIIVKVIDAIISGFDYSKAFMIITEDRDELKEAIVNDIKRGVTILDGKGGYTNNDKSILLVVVNNKKQEVSLKKLIKKVDPSAFIIVSDVHEVLGEGFKSIAA